jgi:hypothetical protein
MRPSCSFVMILLAILLLSTATTQSITNLSPFQLAMTIREPDPQITELMVLFYDSRCKHCSAFLPVLEQVDVLVQHYGTKVKIAKLDTIGHPEFIIAYNLRFFPSLLYFSHGEFKEILPTQLYDTPQQVASWLNQHLAAAHLAPIPIPAAHQTLSTDLPPVLSVSSQSSQPPSRTNSALSSQITKLPLLTHRPTPLLPSQSPATPSEATANIPRDTIQASSRVKTANGLTRQEGNQATRK